MFPVQKQNAQKVHSDFMHGLLINPEDGDDRVDRNVGCPPIHYMTLYCRICNYLRVVCKILRINSDHFLEYT
jgi:hypothetical protein